MKKSTGIIEGIFVFVVLILLAAMTFWIFPIMYLLRRMGRRKVAFYCVKCGEVVHEDPVIHDYKHLIG